LAGAVTPATTAAPTVYLPTAPAFLQDVCTQQKIANTEGKILCQDACKAAECCWKTETCKDTDKCDGYVACAVLVEDLIENETGGTTGTATSTTESTAIEPAPGYLEIVCTTGFEEDVVHNHLCQKGCDAAACCWQTASDTACTSEPNCAGYLVCDTVDFSKGATSPPAEDTTTSTTAAGTTSTATAAPMDTSKYTEEMITDVCLNHDNSIVNLCAKICLGSECCFETDGADCGDFPCTKYSACSVLHPEESAVDQACNASEDLADCVGACGGSTCCFTTDIAKACDITNPGIICSRYKSCEKLYGF